MRQTINFFAAIDGTRLDFPLLRGEDLKNFALGIYALRQAVSYVAEHMKLHGRFQISILPNKYVWALFGKICANEHFARPMFICTKIKSRFRSQKNHTVYILYDSTELLQSRMHYLCECQHGQRTVGCCSHVMAVVWYLGFGRHNEAKDPTSHLNDFFENII